MDRSSPLGTVLLRSFVVAAPVLLALLTSLYIGRPSIYFLAPGAALAVALLACDGWIIARRDWISGGLALTTQIAFVVFVSGYTASPLPAPSALSDPLPKASPPAGMTIYALPTGVNHRTAAFAYRGGSPWEKRDSVSTAVLVRHPQGDILIDTGLGRAIASQLKQFPSCFDLEPIWCNYSRPPISSMPQGTIANTCAISSSPTRTGIT